MISPFWLVYYEECDTPELCSEKVFNGSLTTPLAPSRIVPVRKVQEHTARQLLHESEASTYLLSTVLPMENFGRF
jgi:hypothetical protein